MKIKKGFTLAEIAIVFVVIGIITSVTVNTIKTYQKTGKILYARAYQTVATINYNILDEQTYPEDAKSMCTAYASIMNNILNNCTKTGVTPYASTTKDTNAQISSLDYPISTNTMIKASNSMNFYFSERRALSFTTEEGIAISLKYFLVFVDLNGDLAPNKIITTPKDKFSDLVYFAIFSDGNTIPMGRPTLDTTYLPTRITYPADATHEDEYYSKTMTYWEAIQKAYGKDLTKKIYNGSINNINMDGIVFSSSPLKITIPAITETDSHCNLTEIDCVVEPIEYY